MARTGARWSYGLVTTLAVNRADGNWIEFADNAQWPATARASRSCSSAAAACHEEAKHRVSRLRDSDARKMCLESRPSIAARSAVHGHGGMASLTDGEIRGGAL